MKSEFEFDSAKEITPEFLQNIVSAFGTKPVRLSIEEIKPTINSSSKSTDGKYSKELTDTVLDVIFDALSKTKRK